LHVLRGRAADANALSQLLFLGTPDRLLIEPTGLGHPVEVLQTLYSEAYRESLEVQSTVTLDRRQIRYQRTSCQPR